MEMWSFALSQNFKLWWQKVRLKHHNKRDVNFMWAFWHQALDVNSWIRNINKNIIIQSPSYDSTSSKTIIHRFWSCLKVKKAWELAFSFLFNLEMLIIEDQPRKTLSLKQCIFNGRLPNNLRRFNLGGLCCVALLCGLFGSSKMIHSSTWLSGKMLNLKEWCGIVC